MLQREMQRILRFFLWEAAEWDDRAKISFEDKILSEGYQAYAMRQAALRRRRHDYSQHAWRSVAQYVRWGDAALNGDDSQDGNAPETIRMDLLDVTETADASDVDG